MINIRINKKNHKKKKPNCGYREIWICQAESVRASNSVVEAQLCGFSLSACSRNKYSPVVEVQLCRLVVGINIA